MKRSEGIALLTQCADAQGKHWFGGVVWDAEECPTCHGTNDAGWLHTPCTRYGSTSAECAPVAWRLAYVLTRDTGEDITREDLEYAMRLVVNDSDEVAYTIRNYGHRMYV